MLSRHFFSSFITLVALLLILPAHAQDTQPSTPSFQELEAESRAIKAEVLDLEAELSALEQDIHYPASTRWTVFVTATEGNSAQLQQIELQMDGRSIANHQYSAQEQQALRKGGAHRLYIGSISPGEHPVTVRYTSLTAGQTVNNSTNFVVSKPVGPRLLELRWQPESDESKRLSHKSYADTP